MSMDHFLWPLLYFLFPLATIAGQPTASLAPSLISRIPPCAQACVESFVLKEFSASLCPPQKDLGCLCTGTSASGLTLGEGSLQCVAANCANHDLRSEWLAYEICIGITGAVSMTHKTLTATQAALVLSSTSTRKSSHSSKSSSSHRLPSKKSTSATVTSPTSTSRSQATNRSATSLLTPASKPHPSTSASATPSQSPTIVPVPGNKKVLSKSQIAGIIVAGVGTVAVIIGIVLFLCCARRKRSKKRSSSPSFVGDNGVLSLANTPSLPDARNPDMEQGHISRDYAVVGGQHGSVIPRRNNDSQTSLLGGNFLPDDIGVALASEMREISTIQETSPSAASHRTNSTLLPDKPSYSLFPSPKRTKPTRCQKNSAGSPLLGEAGARQTSLTPSPRPSPQARDTNQRQLQHGYSPLQTSASDPFLDSQYKSHSGTYSNQQRRHLRLETPSNDRSSLGLTRWTQSMDNLHKPVATHQSTGNGQLNQNGAASASISPSEYTGRPVFDPLGALQPQPRKTIPARSKRSIQRRPSTRYSTASETSFDTTGDDDETPPLPAIHATLPPVQESSTLLSTNSRVTSAMPGRSESIPELGSPTRKPIRRKELQPAPLVTQNPAQKKLKGILKPLPDVPEHSDGPAGNLSSVQDAQKPTAFATESDRKTAKYQILINSGLRGIRDTGTPKSGKSVEWAPSPPTARTPTTPTGTGETRIHTPLSPTIKFV